MRRLVSGVLFASIVLPSAAWAAAASRADCVRACAEQIAACEDVCVGFGGGRFGPGGPKLANACRNSVIKTCRRRGLATCDATVTTTTTTIAGGSSSTVTTRPSTSSSSTVTSTTLHTTTSSTTPPSGLSGLIGTWQFRFTIISTFTSVYDFDHVEYVNGIQTLIGSDQYGGLVVANRTADLGGGSSYEFAMLDPGPILCDFYLFNRTGTTTISGQHYNSDVDFDGSCGSLIGGPDPLTGSRLSTTAAALLTGDTSVDTTSRTAAIVRDRIQTGPAMIDESSEVLLRRLGGLFQR